MGILICQYKDPCKPISIMEWQQGFDRCSCGFSTETSQWKTTRWRHEKIGPGPDSNEVRVIRTSLDIERQQKWYQRRCWLKGFINHHEPFTRPKNQEIIYPPLKSGWLWQGVEVGPEKRNPTWQDAKQEWLDAGVKKIESMWAGQAG